MAGATVDTKNNLLFRILSNSEMLQTNECTASFGRSNSQEQEVKLQLSKIKVTNRVACFSRHFKPYYLAEQRDMLSFNFCHNNGFK